MTKSFPFNTCKLKVSKKSDHNTKYFYSKFLSNFLGHGSLTTITNRTEPPNWTTESPIRQM